MVQPISLGPAPSPMIDVRHASHVYNGERGPVEALRDVTFSVGRAEFIALVGPTGCGKSTLLRAISGLLRPTAGRILVGGTVVSGPRTDVGMMFQEPVLFPWKSVRENLEAPARLSGAPATPAKTVNGLLEMTGLRGRAGAYPRELSLGMQHMLSYCMALVMDPSVMLLDEPFAALDAMSREQMGETLLRVWSAWERTVVLVTHSIDEAVFLSDRVLVSSARPGGIIANIEVPLPRPRTTELMRAPEFMATVNEIRTELAREYDR